MHVFVCVRACARMRVCMRSGIACGMESVEAGGRYYKWVKLMNDRHSYLHRDYWFEGPLAGK